MIFLIYTTLVILHQYKGVTTVVTDPCPSDIKNSPIAVADMCKSISAKEDDTHSGNFIVDSVVLRIMEQQDNCICRVTLDNQIQPASIGLRKYDGLSSSAPEEAECGLAVDINHIPAMSTGSVIDPIKCLENVNFRFIPLFENNALQLKSRIINGNFTRGYCMQIQRDSTSDPTQVLRIACDTPMTREQRTVTERTTRDTTSMDIPTRNIVTTNTLNCDDKNIDDKKAYIAVSVFSSTVAIILLVVLVVTCIRNKAMQNTRRTNDDGNNKHYCDLKNNVPSVPGQEYDIIDGNYNTIEMDRPQPSNAIVGMEGEYISVGPDGHLTTTMN